MQTLAVFWGGRSVEHDVSIISGLQAALSADKAKYNVVPVYISREGVWYTGWRLMDIAFFKAFDARMVTRCMVAPGCGNKLLAAKAGFFGRQKTLHEIDAALLVMHGLNGEDGTLQGVLELCGIPYTSSGVTGSAACMDKIVMRAALKGAGFPVVESCWFDRVEWEKDRNGVLDKTVEAVGLPAYVKPANLGSSIGITRADDREGLATAIDVAASYDRRITVEKAVLEPTEVNCSCLGWGDEVEASVCEQPERWQEFLTFEDKYMRGGKSGKGGPKSQGMSSLGRKMPAPIGDVLTKEIQEMSRDVFRVLDLKGVVRIDYFIDKNGKLLIGEVNTIPGSLAFYLWEFGGMSFSKLIDRMVECALMMHKEREKNSYAYNSDILNKVGGSKR